MQYRVQFFICHIALQTKQTLKLCITVLLDHVEFLVVVHKLLHAVVKRKGLDPQIIYAQSLFGE